MPRLDNLMLNIVTAVVAVAAVIMVSLRLYQHLNPGATEQQRPRRIDNWREFARNGNRLGPEKAAVTIVEFTDFQCPFCRKVAAELAETRKAFPDRVAIVVRHFPLNGHKFAKGAAIAAECASRQGALEAYSESLFSLQSLIGRKGWAEFARDSGVPDISIFEKCLEDPSLPGLIQRDIADGEKLGINGTPTLLVNGLEVTGYLGEGKLGTIIQSALNDRGR